MIRIEFHKLRINILRNQVFFHDTIGLKLTIFSHMVQIDHFLAHIEVLRLILFKIGRIEQLISIIMKSFRAWELLRVNSDHG